MSDLADRLLAKDPTLWPTGNVSPTRLGWLDSPALMLEQADDLQSWAAMASTERVVLIGMGGSSLGPEVLRAAAGAENLLVLDTTDPATVASAVFDEGTLVIVSSKSGGTLEVQSLLAHAWAKLPDPSRYVAVTDPDTGLFRQATERGFGRVFVNDPNIGGRYSVLSLFGLVPAALLGYDVAELCRRAQAVDVEEAVELGVAMGAGARAGKDKLTLVVPPPFRELGLWLEQLVAESTGKQGMGCIPVPTPEAEEGFDRNIVAIHVGDRHDLAAEFQRWEIATAIAGNVLNIDPFDEPNVAESKANTGRVLDALPLPDVESSAPDALFPWLGENAEAGDYVSIQAYLPYGSEDSLERLRVKVRDRLDGIAVTAGYGPRFLHSTGQLHKGGPNTCVAVQIVPPKATADLDVPGMPYDFATLIAAQSIGDLQSLRDHGRRVLRITAESPEQLF